MLKKVEIKSKDSKDNEVTVFVVSPNDEAYRKAQKAASRAFRDAVVGGALLRTKLEDYMKEQGIWDDAKQQELEKLQKDIEDKIKKLTDKGASLTLEEGRKLAIEVRVDRARQLQLSSIRSNLDEYTVEGQADNVKFDTLVSLCVLNEKGEQVFADLGDYRNRMNEPYASDAAARLSMMIYDFDPSWQSKLPENQFLKRFGFVNEELRLVNDQGKYVNAEGQLIDKDGRLVDDNGNLLSGVDMTAEFDFSHFLKVEPVEETTVKRGRPKKEE